MQRRSLFGGLCALFLPRGPAPGLGMEVATLKEHTMQLDLEPIKESLRQLVQEQLIKIPISLIQPDEVWLQTFVVTTDDLLSYESQS